MMFRTWTLTFRGVLAQLRADYLTVRWSDRESIQYIEMTGPAQVNLRSDFVFVDATVFDEHGHIFWAVQAS